MVGGKERKQAIICQHDRWPIIYGALSERAVVQLHGSCLHQRKRRRVCLVAHSGVAACGETVAVPFTGGERAAWRSPRAICGIQRMKSSGSGRVTLVTRIVSSLDSL